MVVHWALDLSKISITFHFYVLLTFAFDLNLIFHWNALSDVNRHRNHQSATCWLRKTQLVLIGQWQIIIMMADGWWLMVSFDQTLTMILSNYSNKWMNSKLIPLDDDVYSTFKTIKYANCKLKLLCKFRHIEWVLRVQRTLKLLLLSFTWNFEVNRMFGLEYFVYILPTDWMILLFVSSIVRSFICRCQNIYIAIRLIEWFGFDQ